jgi:hypothetical protein
VIWIGFLVAPGILNNLGVPGSSLLNVTGNGQPTWTYSELFGRSILGPLPDWSDLFYGGLLLLGLGAFAWGSTPGVSSGARPDRRVDRGRPARHADRRGGMSPRRQPPRPRMPPQRFLRARNARRSPARRPAGSRDRLRSDSRSERSGSAPFSAEMAIVNRGETPITSLTMTLADSLDITESSLPFTRDSSRLDFTLPEPLEPGETVSLRLAYQGTVWRAEDWAATCATSRSSSRAAWRCRWARAGIRWWAGPPPPPT